MFRTTLVLRAPDDTIADPLPAPDAVHDPDLAETLRRLTAPPVPVAPKRAAARPEIDRAVYGLD